MPLIMYIVISSITKIAEFYLAHMCHIFHCKKKQRDLEYKFFKENFSIPFFPKTCFRPTKCAKLLLTLSEENKYFKFSSCLDFKKSKEDIPPLAQAPNQFFKTFGPFYENSQHFCGPAPS